MKEKDTESQRESKMARKTEEERWGRGDGQRGEMGRETGRGWEGERGSVERETDQAWSSQDTNLHPD